MENVIDLDQRRARSCTIIKGHRVNVDTTVKPDLDVGGSAKG